MKTLCCRDYRTAGWCSRCEVGDLAGCQDRLTIEQDPPPKSIRRGRPMRLIVKVLIGLAAWHTLLGILTLTGQPVGDTPFVGHAALASMYLVMAAIGRGLLRRADRRSRL